MHRRIYAAATLVAVLLASCAQLPVPAQTAATVNPAAGTSPEAPVFSSAQAVRGNRDAANSSNSHGYRERINTSFELSNQRQ